MADNSSQRESTGGEVRPTSDEFGLWRSPHPKTALTVAGLDPSGGAGIIADLRTFDALGVYGMAVVSTLTVQGTQGMKRRNDVSPAIIGEQIEAIFADTRPNAVKTGALGGREIILEIYACLKKADYTGPLVIDPVFASSGGAPLMDESGVKALREVLLPLSTLLTPNAREASTLCGFEIFEVVDAEAAALRLMSLGARAVLITGIKVEGAGQALSADVFCEGKKIEVLESPWTESLDVHGTGCVISAAATAGLAKAKDVRGAVLDARRFVRASVEAAIRPGKGASVANPHAGTRASDHSTDEGRRK